MGGRGEGPKLNSTLFGKGVVYLCVALFVLFLSFVYFSINRVRSGADPAASGNGSDYGSDVIGTIC